MPRMPPKRSELPAVRYPQLLVYEGDGRLAALLRPLASAEGWSLREPGRADTCLRLLGRGGSNLLVLRTGRDLDRELTLLDQVRGRFPDTAVVVVTDADHARLVGLAWDLGAAYVLGQDQAREQLTGLAAGLLRQGGEA